MLDPMFRPHQCSPMSSHFSKNENVPYCLDFCKVLVLNVSADIDGGVVLCGGGVSAQSRAATSTGHHAIHDHLTSASTLSTGIYSNNRLNSCHLAIYWHIPSPSSATTLSTGTIVLFPSTIFSSSPRVLAPLRQHPSQRLPATKQSTDTSSSLYGDNLINAYLPSRNQLGPPLITYG